MVTNGSWWGKGFGKAEMIVLGQKWAWLLGRESPVSWGASHACKGISAPGTAPSTAPSRTLPSASPTGGRPGPQMAEREGPSWGSICYGLLGVLDVSVVHPFLGGWGRAVQRRAVRTCSSPDDQGWVSRTRLSPPGRGSATRRRTAVWGQAPNLILGSHIIISVEPELCWWIWEMGALTPSQPRVHVCTLSRFSHVQLFVTLWTVALQAPLCVHGILQARILEWVAMPSSRESLRHRNWTHISCISCIAVSYFTHWVTWEAPA